MLINCDLGEWEAKEETEWMMQRIHFANVACGYHAGSVEQIAYCREIAQRFEVKCGIHPGVKGEGGRGFVNCLSVCEFYDLLEAQYVIFEKYAGTPSHIKLHGNLYHLSESHSDIADAYLDFVKSVDIPVVALSGGRICQLAGQLNLKCYSEIFVDRNYDAKGNLIPRKNENAELLTEEEIRERVNGINESKAVIAIDGSVLSMQFDTICVHSDSVLSKYALSLLT